MERERSEEERSNRVGTGEKINSGGASMLRDNCQKTRQRRFGSTHSDHRDVWFLTLLVLG